VQEFAEAEEEEAAALELQKASYSRLTAADFDDDAVSSNSDSDSDADTTTSATAAASAAAAASDSLGARLQQQEQEQATSSSSSSSRKKAKKGPTVDGESPSADAAGLRGELEALLSGRAAADVGSSGPTSSSTTAASVEVATVRRDLSKLSRKDKLALVIGDSPELPGLCASLHAVLEELCEKIDPLAQEVTADLGASDDGLLYLQVHVVLI
jgi:hypothetical protein